MIMDHDLDEMLLANGVSSSTNRTMTATTLNGTVSASDNATTTILNLFRYSAPPPTVSTFRQPLPPPQQQMNKNHFIPDMILSALSSPTPSIAAPERTLPTSNLTNSTVGGVPSSIPNSCSLIFDTAASFNINQQDTVVYARESIRLLAKSLALYSDHYQIIQRLYAYAPDNLAWLWAFFDWESPIDLSHVACQDSYEPFGWCDEEMISAGLTDEQMTQISRIYADAPLIQYKYRQELMIGDLHNFLQHINEKVPFRPVAISLLVLYFPRFAPFINNPWKNILNPKILSSNVSLIRELDTMLVKLIGTRYNNIREYKKRIYDGPHGLPTYVSEALKEINFWSSSSAANQLLVKNLTSGMTTSMSNQSASFDRMLNNLELIRNNVTDGDVGAAVNNGAATTTMTSSMAVGGSRALPPPPLSLATTTSSASSATLTNEVVAAANFSQSIEDFLKTYNYLRLLQKNKVNSHLDYADDMEEKTSRLSNETSNDDDQSQQQASNSSSTGSTEEDQQQQTRSTTNLYTQFGELKLDEMPSSTTTTIDDQQQHMRIISSPILCSPPPQPLNESLNTSATMMMEMMMSSYRQHQQQQQQQQNTESYRRMNCMSPPPPPPQQQQYPTYHQPSTGRNILNTPQTPSNCFDTTWSKSQHQRSINMQTPPPSACKTTDAPISSFYTDTTHYETAKNATTTANGTVFVSSPIPVNRDANSQMFFGRRKGAAAANTPQPLLSLNMNKSTPYHNNMSMLNETDYSSAALATPAAATPNEFVMPPSYANTLGALNVNTNLSPTSNGSLFSPAMNASPIELSSNAHHTNSSYHYRQQNTPTKRHNNSNNHNNSHLTMASPSGHHYSPHMRAWKGQLPPKIYPSGAVYSRKVFLGGLPWDLNQNTLMASLFKYGTVRIEVPGKDSKHPRVAAHAATPNGARSPYPERNTPGYVYMIFDHEASVARLLADCHKQIRNGGEHYFYSIFIPPSPHHYDSHRGYSPAGRRQGKVKEVEVIPWNQEDTSYVPQFGVENAPPAKIETSLTVFVGGLHGMCNAQGLCTVMSEVFGEVIHASLDVDKHKYPIGSGRVTFRHRQSYVKAIKAQYVHIKANQEPEDPSPKFEKTIQIDPYLDDCKCSKCEVKASLFCRNECCLENFCVNCWSYRHDQSVNGEHIALSRQTKPNHHI